MTTAQAAFSEEVTIRRRRFVNPETGFAVLEGETDEDVVVLVGPLGHLEAEDRARVSGVWVQDRRYGDQVKVTEALPLAPTSPAALEEYLRKVRHIGSRRAQRLIDHFGEDVLEQIDADPHLAFAAVGLHGRRAAEATESWEALRVLRDLHLLLAPHGLAYLAARIHRHYGDGAHRVLREQPYDLTGVFGVGFRIADQIARGVGIGPDSPARAAAAMQHCLAVAERDGSTCLPLPSLRARAADLLDSAAPSLTLVDDLVAAGELARVDDGEESWIYRESTERLEAELAERVLELAGAEPTLKVPDAVPPDALPDGAELAGEQWHGVRDAFARRLSLITGGPGTGKTASIRAIGAVAARQKAETLLVAPTGRAAKRMTEATGLFATTIHSALGWIPGKGALHDEDDPLGCDLLIVDESSMASLEVMVTLLRAVGEGTHVVLVGDADQLAPVGAGKPFAELVESELVPAARLRHIFRQAAGSMIVQGAHAIRVGTPPSFATVEGMRRDLFLIEHADPVRARDEIVELVAERLPAHYGVDPVADIQVLAPVYAGELGIDALNARLREALNPHGEPARNGRLRLGDKLMLSGRNLHELGLMNGTVLRLEAAHEEDDDDGHLVVAADDEERFELDLDDADSLRLAYACSVHKGQGIEVPIAIVVAHPAAGGFFLRRELLYTAVTRARTATVVVGTRDCIARAVRRTDSGRRYSRLVPRLHAA